MSTETPDAAPATAPATNSMSPAEALAFLAQCARDHCATLTPASKLATINHANVALAVLRTAIGIGGQVKPAAVAPPEPPVVKPKRRRGR
jgi:hypothetical protein